MKNVTITTTTTTSTKREVVLTEDALESILQDYFKMPLGKFDFGQGSGNYLPEFTLTEISESSEETSI